MSQIIALKRKISRDEVAEVVRGLADFEIREEHRWGLTIAYTPSPDEHLIWMNGELQTTSPGDALYGELEKLATALSAEIVHEEEEIMPPGPDARGTVNTISLFWPLLSIISIGLLIWKW